MKKIAARVLTVSVVIVALAGCGADWKAEIESNTNWYGYYGGVTGNNWSYSEVQGSGSREMDLPDDDRVCCRFFQTAYGYLNITIKDDGGGPFHIFAADSRSGSTNAIGGMIEICSEGIIPRE
jgi:hypothetical protein